MKHAFLISLGFAVCAFAASPALADPIAIRAQMLAGEYETAYVQAETLTTADGYALAAECLLSEVMLGEAEKNKKLSKRARDLAVKALHIDPAHQNARLQYAIADGFVTREAGDMSAWIKKLPQKTEAIVQDYRRAFPDDPRGDALLGAWNLAIARKAEDKNAQKWFGASIAQGRDLFLAARAKAPDDPTIGVSYALALIGLQDDDMPTTDEARAILVEMDRATPTDHMGRTMQAYGREALKRLDDRDAARAYAEMFLDGNFPD